MVDRIFWTRGRCLETTSNALGRSMIFEMDVYAAEAPWSNPMADITALRGSMTSGAMMVAGESEQSV